MEIGRHSQSLVREQKLKDLEKRNEETRRELSEARRSLVGFDDKMQNTQKDYVTILGIFAAVVLAFTGGLSFSTSLFENLNQSNVYRIVGITAMVGFVLFNLIYVLFDFIGQVSSRKKSPSKVALIITDTVLVIILILTAIAWFGGWAEKRDDRYSANSAAYSIEDRNLPANSTISPSEEILEP